MVRAVKKTFVRKFSLLFNTLRQCDTCAHVDFEILCTFVTARQGAATTTPDAQSPHVPAPASTQEPESTKEQSRIPQCADVVRVSPARKPPPLRFISEAARAALDTPGAADRSFLDAEDSYEALVRPPVGCSSTQRRTGAWLQNKAHCPGTLIAIFYMLKLRTWVGSVVRSLLLLPIYSGACARHLCEGTISILSRRNSMALSLQRPRHAAGWCNDEGDNMCKGTPRFLSVCIWQSIGAFWKHAQRSDCVRTLYILGAGAGVAMWSSDSSPGIARPRVHYGFSGSLDGVQPGYARAGRV